MKKTLWIAVFFVCFPSLQLLSAIVLESSLSISNFAPKGDDSKMPDFGGVVSIEEQIFHNIGLKVKIERDSEIGNKISGVFSYIGSFIQVSLGPSFGVLNSVSKKMDAISSFQPGLEVGIFVAASNGFLFGLSGDFAMSVIDAHNNMVFLQSGGVALGYRFPNLLAQLRFSHKGRGSVLNGAQSFFSIMDYGLYTEAFSKPSRFRIPVNFIFRNVRYNSAVPFRENKNYGSLVFEMGMNFVLNSDAEIGFLAGAALYSFTLGREVDDIKKFFFRSKCGVKISL